MPRRSFTRAVIHAPRSIFERRVTPMRDKDETAFAVLALVAGVAC